MKGRAWMALWPGLAGLWLRGHWFDLVLGAGFALAVNFTLIVAFVWPQLVTRDLPKWAAPLAGWVLVLWFWVVGWRRSACTLAQQAAKSLQPDAVSDTLLCEAQLEYVKGHWLEAETLLLRLVSRRPGDAEARLLLASVYRRSGNCPQARQQLAELSNLPAAVRWHEEIALENRKLSPPKHAVSSEQLIVPNPSISSQQRAA